MQDTSGSVTLTSSLPGQSWGRTRSQESELAKAVGHEGAITEAFGLHRTFPVTSFLLSPGPFPLDDQVEACSSLLKGHGLHKKNQGWDRGWLS